MSSDYDYIRKLEREYDKDPVAFERRTKEMQEGTKEIQRIMSNFAKEVDEFNKEA